MFGSGGFASVIDYLGRSYRFARRATAPTLGKAAIWTSDGATLKFTNEAGTTTNMATASSLSFDDLASGTNTTAAMLVGAGASLGVASTGTIDPVMSAAHGLTWTGRSKATSSADGVINLTNNAGTGFTRLALGPASTVGYSLQLVASNGFQFVRNDGLGYANLYFESGGALFASAGSNRYVRGQSAGTSGVHINSNWIVEGQLMFGAFTTTASTGIAESAAGILKTTNGSSTDYFFLDGPNLKVGLGATSGTTYPAISRDGAGVKVTCADGTTGAFISGVEQTAPAAPSANGYRLFAQDNGAGKTQLMVIFATGAAIPIATEA